MPTDARYRTKVYLETYITAAHLTKDDGATLASYIIAYGFPNYPLVRVFSSPKNVDLVFSIGRAKSTPNYGHDLSIWQYDEEISITTFCLDKTGITGTILKPKAELELRSILELHPLASVRTMVTAEDVDQVISEGTTLYGVKLTLRYRRNTTT